MSRKKTIDNEEIQKFQAMADEWWDPNGKFKPLHMLNPCRLQYILDQIKVQFLLNEDNKKLFSELSVLDIGCGGGLLSEPLTRLGAKVVGVDAAERNISVAKLHASQSDLQIDYRNVAAEDLVGGNEKFDVILNMEIVEQIIRPPGLKSS